MLYDLLRILQNSFVNIAEIPNEKLSILEVTIPLEVILFLIRKSTYIRIRELNKKTKIFLLNKNY